MPVRAGKQRRMDTVTYRNATGQTFNGTVIGDQRPAPGAPAMSTSTTGGTLAAATYSYRVSAVVNGIETLASTAGTQVTTGSTSTVTVDFTATANAKASAHKVYGRTGGSELLMQTVNMPTTTFTDTGSVTPSGALPSTTTNVTILVNSIGLLTNKAKATSYKQTDVYFLR